jgi:CHAD domain-containing protein
MRDAGLFVASRNRGWRDAKRALARAFRIQAEARDEEVRVYYDTFDGRLYRANLELMEVGDHVVLRDARTAETVATGRWAADEGARFARHLEPLELRQQVGTLTDPRVLREVVRARVVANEATLHDADGRLVARVLSEAALVRNGTRSRTSRAVFVTESKQARRTDAVSALRSTLQSAGYRASNVLWADRLLAASGRNAATYASVPRLALDTSATLRTSVVAIFPRLLTVMTRTEPGVREGVDPEFLHDYRVALRRTRTGLAVLSSAFPAEDARTLRARFAKLAAPTGRVRDLEVQLERRFEYATWVPGAFSGGLEPVLSALAHERDAAHAQLSDILEARDYATLKRDWKRALKQLAEGRPAGVGADESALPVARAAIEKRYTRLREIAAASEKLDDAALHRARVQGKKLRYVLEFFARPLGDDAEDAIEYIERLQSSLGEFHDANVQIAALEKLVRDAPDGGRHPHARAGALGAVMSRLEAERAKRRERSIKRLLLLTEKKQARAFERVLDG